MTPMFIGTVERRLYAIHAPASPGTSRPRAALLCQPLGEEYIHAHRVIRQLANQLAERRHHTLRFDYFGTGDSGGSACEVDLEGLNEDVLCALEALQDISGATRVTLIGLRAGANLAARVALQQPQAVEALVLWDPLVAGEPITPADPPLSFGPGDLDVRNSLQRLPRRTLVLVTKHPESWESCCGPMIERMAAPAPWLEEVSNTGALPVAVLHKIEEWLCQNP